MDFDDTDTTIVNHSAVWQQTPLELARMTTEECAIVLAGPLPTVILPIGSTEPHGPHLPLATDVVLAEESARRAADVLRARGVSTVVAPSVAYGVTRYASGFAGAISLSPALMEQLVRELCVAYREAGFALVCVTNHHLEPDHVSAIARAVDGTRAARGGVCFANQLTRRWGRTLSAEFKRGDCHAGSYESSLMLAARPEWVREELRSELPSLPISLSEAIKAGSATFREIGMERAYTGAPSEASAAHGEEQYRLLAEMIVTEVFEALRTRDSSP
jgi:creatinine amidohydrolase